MNDHYESQPELAQLRARIAELEHELQATQQRETRLRYIVEGSSDGAWDWNMVTNEAFHSPRWEEILGYEPGELPQNFESWTNSLHPDDHASVMRRLQECIDGRTTSFWSENRLLHKSGEWIWTVSRGKVVERDTAGKPLRMTGTIIDISERKRVEERFRQNQLLLQALIDNSPALIYVLDTSFRYLLVNRNEAAFLNREREEIIGKFDYELFPPDMIEVFRQSDRPVLEKGETITTEHVVELPDGPHIYVAMKFPIYGETGEMYAMAGISTDVTEMRRAIAERTTLQEQIIDAQRAALRELSTPLIPIADGVVIMPLIGHVDVQRAQQVTENLLEGVAQYRATSVILDITGVEMVDTLVANALVQAAKAVRLLGAEVIVTGIRPEIAQTMVTMGAALQGITTFATLQNGIAYTLRHTFARTS